MTTLSNLIKQEEEKLSKEWDDWWIDSFTKGRVSTHRHIQAFLTASLTRTVKAVLDEVKLEEEHEDYQEETHTDDEGLKTALTFNRGFNQAIDNLENRIKNLLA